MKFAIVIAAFALLGAPAQAAEPVKQIGIYVEPFYRAARTPGEAPQVKVGSRYDALLMSSRREDILKARDAMLADVKTVTPMALMTLAVRLYDVGERDEAVFWFYAAKDRMMILTEVAAPGAKELAQALDAVKNFSTLAGPVINGYAFCDLQNQQAIRARALDWVAANPYQVMFMTQLWARGPDREALAAAGLKLARDNAEKERGYFGNEVNRRSFYALRAQNEADAKFCWK